MGYAESSFSFFNKSNTQREIHIWEFPEGFYIKLKHKVTKDLVNRAAEAAGGIEQLARVLKKDSKSIYNYRACKTFIPISLLLQLCKLAGNEFTIEKLEQHIFAYKRSGRARPILNPNLPLKESHALFALMGHLVGDGGYSIRGKFACYGNSEKILIKKFLRLLQEVFGDVPYRLEVIKNDPPRKDVLVVKFGLTIISLLRHLYRVDFRTYTAQVPAKLIELPREYTAAFLKSFGDDEGYVGDSDIIVCSVSIELMQAIHDLVQVKFPELGVYAVFEKKKQKSDHYLYRVRFKTGAFSQYRMLIGFTHPEKKQELDCILARRERGWNQRNKGVTKRRILKVLSSNPMTRKDLARQIEVTTEMTRRHLKELIALGFVRVLEGETGRNNAITFELTEQGQKFLRLPPIGLLSKHYGRTKVELLKTLKIGRFTVKELGKQLSLAKTPIRQHLLGIRKCRGKWIKGLLELGLVERFGNGSKTDPHIYHLTVKGRRVVEELEKFHNEKMFLTKK